MILRYVLNFKQNKINIYLNKSVLPNLTISKLPFYEQSFKSILFSPLVYSGNQFSYYELKTMSYPMVNKV